MDNIKTAGFYRRAFATLLDRLIEQVITLIVLAPVFILSIPKLTGIQDLITLVAVIISLLIIVNIAIFFYSWFFVTKFGGTLGKLLFKLRIVNEDGKYLDKATAFWRMTAGYSASALFFGLGYLWIFRHKENLSWHDRFFGTKVITKGSALIGIIATIGILAMISGLIGFSIVKIILSNPIQL